MFNQIYLFLSNLRSVPIISSHRYLLIEERIILLMIPSFLMQNLLLMLELSINGFRTNSL